MRRFARVIFLMTATALLGGSAYAKEWDKVFFLEADAGYAIFPYKQYGYLDEVNNPDSDGIAFGAGLGYRLTDNYFFTLNYQRNDLGSVVFDNAYVSANFRFRFKQSSFAPYAGALAGISNMHWNTTPISTAGTIDDSSAYLWGIQFGEEYLLSKHWQLYAAYQYTEARQTTTIVGLGSIEYKTTHMLKLGVRFSFIDP